MKAGLAATGAMMTAAGMGFARAGWAGVKPLPPAAPPADPAAPLPVPNRKGTAVVFLVGLFFLLFGIFAAGCGLLLLIGGLTRS